MGAPGATGPGGDTRASAPVATRGLRRGRGGAGAPRGFGAPRPLPGAAAGAAAFGLGFTVRNFALGLAKWYRWLVRSVVANSYSGVM